MRSILITSRDPILNKSNPTGPGKSIQLIIPIIKNKYKIYLLTTKSKHIFFLKVLNSKASSPNIPRGEI